MDFSGGVLEDEGVASAVVKGVFGIVIVREGAFAVWGGDEELIDVTFL